MNGKKFLKSTQSILIILLILVSAYLVYGDITGSTVCLPSDPSQCSSVRNSIYGTLFGMKLSYFGLAAFLLLGIFYLGGTIEHVRKVTLNNIFLTASVLGALFAAYFLYIQFFILKRICISCLTIDGIMLIVFFVSLTDFILDLNKNNY